MTIPALSRPAWRAPWRAALAVPRPDAPVVDGSVTAPCPGCGAVVERTYCGDCGERAAPDDLSLGALAAGAVEQLTALDVRLLRTVALLVRRPGALALEYRRGVRARYTRPLQLFLLALAALFLALPPARAGKTTRDTFATSPITKGLVPKTEAMMHGTHETPDVFFARFDQRADTVRRGLLALFVPVLAAALAVLHRRRRRYAVEHLVFATHVFSFILLAVVVMVGLAIGTGALVGLAQRWGHPGLRDGLRGPLTVLIFAPAITTVVWHVWAAQRRTYDAPRLGASLRTAGLVVVLVIAWTVFLYAVPRVTLAVM